MKTRITLAATVLTGVMTASMAHPVLADGSADRAALATCVEQHFTPADAGIMANLMTLHIIEGKCINDARRVCNSRIHHSYGEDISSLDIQFELIDGRLVPGSLQCVPTP
jgi:hypothetical protein